MPDISPLGLDYGLIVARLKDQCPHVKDVGESAEFEAATAEAKFRKPAVFVVPLLETPGANRLATGIRQTVTERFGVVMAVENVRDQRGAAARSSLRQLRGEVQAALLGWFPEGVATDPFQRGPGRNMGIRDQVLWWMDEYTTRRYDSNV